ncbi:MAG: hypothetical protein ACKVP1_19830 [Burkholderiaceae bacterium]
MTLPSLFKTCFLSCCLALLTLTPYPVQAQTESIRPEVLRPLIAAQELNNQKKHADALARIAELDSLAAANPLEVFTIERMRAVVMMASNDPGNAAKALEKALLTGRGPAADRLALIENLALIQYRQKDYNGAALWAGRYFELGGQLDGLRTAQTQALYLSGQFKSASELLQQRLADDLKAQRKPEEIQLRLLASSYQQLKDDRAYANTLRSIARYYPKPEVWLELCYRLMKRKDFPSYLEIDVNRLMRATGAQLDAEDLMEQAQLALRTGFTAEARDILVAAKALAKNAAPADALRLDEALAKVMRMQEEDKETLSDLDAQLAKAGDANPLVNVGLNLAINGQFERAIAALELAFNKGGLRQPEAARLRQAYVLSLAGQRDKAITALAAVSGESAEAELAQLWRLHLERRP